MIHGFIVDALTEGMGAIERKATARHDSVDVAAASWAWLVAVGRSNGQEWHFETNARDRGGVWSIPTQTMWSIGKALVEATEEELSDLQSKWNDAFDELVVNTGQ